MQICGVMVFAIVSTALIINKVIIIVIILVSVVMWPICSHPALKVSRSVLSGEEMHIQWIYQYTMAIAEGYRHFVFPIFGHN